MRTQVAIVGAGPAGLMLGHLLHLQGIESVVVEIKSRDYAEHRVRAGVLEQPTVDLLYETGLGGRLAAEGLTHEGIALRFRGRSHRIDFADLTGSGITVYGQQEVVKDLIAARLDAGLPLHFEVDNVRIEDLDGEHPRVLFTHDGAGQLLAADIVAGCDGFHGVSRHAIPSDVRREYERLYPFGWMGVLSETPPVSHELIYSRHPRGFALCSMRNPMLSRYYIQCTADTDAASWTDQQFWDELRRRIPEEAAASMVTGPSIEKSVTPLRSYVAEPMQWGNLFLAGDAAHIVPPTGAKGLNLAFSDVYYLAEALSQRYSNGSTTALEGYGATALRRVWKAVRFSWWMTTMLHTFHDAGDFEHRMQETELDYLAGSVAAQTAMAENYTGLPF